MSGVEDAQVAIIGLAGRFPGARDVNEFWRNLVGGVESITFFSDDELREAGVPDSHIADPSYVKAAPITEGADMFDAGYFGMSPREAEILDPQHRIFLEECETALQHGGYDPGAYQGRIGVYGGVGFNNYLEDNVNKHPEVIGVMGKLSTNISNTADYLATGVSYRLGLRGPSFTCLSACSTSMVAIHLACQALRDGDCEMALAGGVEEFIPRVSGYFYSEGSLYSPDGHCRTFDAKARGTVFGSGAGVVLLKRLDAALADGDNVLAVIRGTAINNDGSAKGAFTAPSVEGQLAAVSDALTRSGVDPATISYVEAHGTSTFVGDPIEVTALTKAFRQHTERRHYCGIGSVKTNVGHLGAAAGVAGLIKTVLAMKHRVLPPHLNYDEPNPQIDFDNSPFYVNTDITPWKSDSGPLRASVSSFGVGGTNGHLILEEAPAVTPSSAPKRAEQLLLFSARTPSALESTAAAVGAHLRERPEELADAAYTLAVGRPVRQVRSFLVAGDGAEAGDRLAAGVPQPTTGVVPPRGGSRAVAFAFPGQGAQYPQMGRDLYDSEPVFRTEVDECAEVLLAHTGWDLRELLYGTGDEAALAQRLNQTEVTQPALFVVEYAMARLVQSWGLTPDAMVGHSVGEYVAATLAGVFTRDDALRLVAERGRLMQQLPSGSMLAVPLPEETLASLLPADLDLAAVNGPGLSVVSGTHAAVEQFEAVLGVQGMQGRRLHTSHAFHSRMMDPILEQFTELVAAVARREPTVAFVSNLTGDWITAEQATDPGYWAAHLRNAVRFDDAVRLLTEGDKRVLVELGPGQTLTGLARRRLPADKQGLVVPTMRHPQRRQPDTTVLLGALGQAWQAGAAVDFSALWSGETRYRVVLPRVPYEKQRSWLDGVATVTETQDVAVSTETGPYYVPVWKQTALPAPGEVDTDAVWLVFEPAGENPVNALTGRLRSAGARVVTVRAGDEPSADGDAYVVRAGEAADYPAVVAAALTRQPGRLRVVHGWLVGDLSGATARDRARAGLDHGFFSILATAQALSRNPVSPPLDVYLLTSELRDVVGGERIEPVKSGVDGFVRLLPKEFSDTTCRSVDVAGGTPDSVAEQVLREITSAVGDQVVAYRGRKRWTWAHEEVALDGVGAAQRLLRDGGVYLITGGLGGIGLVTAKDLAERHQAKLVLTGRSGLPPRDQWDDLLAGAESPTTARITAVREIEAAGGEVLVVAADVTDPDQLREVRAQAEATFGPVSGVLHAAGITGGGMLETRQFADAEAVLSAKVFGTLAIEEVFGDSLDLIVLYSSFTVFSGDFGLFDYCSANAILDAYAHARQEGRTHVVSVNWPIWSKLGMAFEIDAPDLLTSFEMGDRFEQVTHPLLGSRLVRAGSDQVIFVKNLSTDDWVTAEHQLAHVPTMPGTSLVEMVRAAYQEVTGEATAEVRDVVFMRPLSFDESRTVHVILTPAQGGSYDVLIADADAGGGNPVEFTTARVGPGPRDDAPRHDLSAWRATCAVEDEAEAATEGIISLGPRWQQAIKGHWHSESTEAGLFDELVLLELGEEFLADLTQFGLHPALLDKATALGQTVVASQTSHLPFGYDRITVRGTLPRRFYSYIRHLDDTRGALIRTDITLVDTDGVELVAIKGFTMFEYADTTMSTDGSPDATAQADTDDDESQFSVARQLERALLRSNEKAFGIEPDDGYPMLHRMLDSGAAPQVIVCPDSFVKRMRMAAEVTRDALREQLMAAPKPTSSVATRSLLTPYVEPDGDVERVLAAMWADTLGLDAVGAEDDFFDLNGNSLIAVQLVARIRDQFQVDLTVAGLFEARTVRALAGRIEELVVELLAGLSDEEAAARLASITTRN
ncbi:SDR family NAD(P)-dependent oxidoreductase [Micromonospora sp. NPDC000207]|uniref:type I polyketide synthase n=1 Tax=Micromonospora sp. NPDC000207 TaxID=3154246 RepID=UPI00331EC283